MVNKSIAKKEVESQICSDVRENIHLNDIHISTLEQLDEYVRGFVRMVIDKALNEEFRNFIGVERYVRGDGRKDCRNGFRYRSLETSFGFIEDIKIPRSRKNNFYPSIFQRWKRSEKRIKRLISDMFLNGISTRKVKILTKTIFGKRYSHSTVSRFNQSLQEDLIEWLNRPITKKIRYLILDAVNLKVRRHWISKESLLCAIGITSDGYKTFLGFMLGGRESTQSWEDFLTHLIRRGLDPEGVSLVTCDGNPGLLKALETNMPDVRIQRCTVHKINNIYSNAGKSVRNLVKEEAKRIFSCTSKQEALSRFEEWKGKWEGTVPKAVKCLEKDLENCLSFYDYPYRHWTKIRTTNLIERAFKEFRRRIKIMETFPNESSCIRIMFSLSKLLDENWKYKPINGF
jgi:putative transposase